jgi:hypothetical protein
MAHSDDGSKLIRIRHTESATENMEKVREVMNLVNQQFEATAEQYRALATKQFNQKDVLRYVNIMLNCEFDAEDDISTRTKNIRTNILNRVEGEKQNLPGVKGTWWGAYNAFTEHLNYEAGRNQNSRLDRLWFNPQNDARKALKVALQLSGVTGDGN